MVTDDEREDITASIVAHDMMLQFLMAHIIQLFPTGRRQELVNAILGMPDLPIPDGMARDFDSADRLAGISQKVKANMQRMTAEAARAAGV